MNLLLWIFQLALALLSFAGGAYKVDRPRDSARRQNIWRDKACGALRSRATTSTTPAGAK